MTKSATREAYALKIQAIIENNPTMPLRDLNRLLSDCNPGDTQFQLKEWKLETDSQLKDRPKI